MKPVSFSLWISIWKEGNWIKVISLSCEGKIVWLITIVTKYSGKAALLGNQRQCKAK